MYQSVASTRLLAGIFWGPTYPVGQSTGALPPYFRGERCRAGSTTVTGAYGGGPSVLALIFKPVLRRHPDRSSSSPPLPVSRLSPPVVETGLSSSPNDDVGILRSLRPMIS